MILAMMPNPNDDIHGLRAQIAAVAARMIAQDGAEYAVAKRKAALQVLGEASNRANLLPDDLQIEEEVRRYQELFQADTQPARVRDLRAIALRIMEDMEEFTPYLTGAVLNGTAGEHDDIHLQLFTENAKDVEIFLLNRNVTMEVSETTHFKGGRRDPVETISFMWKNDGVHLEIYDRDDLRGALKQRADGRPQRADAAALRAMIEAADPTN
jgi:hypothetical protein